MTGEGPGDKTDQKSQERAPEHGRHGPSPLLAGREEVPQLHLLQSYGGLLLLHRDHDFRNAEDAHGHGEKIDALPEIVDPEREPLCPGDHVHPHGPEGHPHQDHDGGLKEGAAGQADQEHQPAYRRWPKIPPARTGGRCPKGRGPRP